MVVHSRMTCYNPGTEDLRAYVERLDWYFMANKINSAERKQAILLSVCSLTTYQLIHDLVYPQKPAEETYNELVEIVMKHYNPIPSVTIQIYKFYLRKIGKDDSISDYVAVLRQLSEFVSSGIALK